MGVPSFYRWLVTKYPKILAKNRNGIEFDNLYLDMNCIICVCSNPDDDSPDPTATVIFDNIYSYIDHLFTIVRPRKLLYMAIDGVAPRAKMNKQRLSYFHSAKTNELADAEAERLVKEFEMAGKHIFAKRGTENGDLIAPGSEFMCLLSEKLKVYVDSRMNADPTWKDIQVIISDANAPGEGEHKIMSFIRNQRSFPNYNPNTTHCLYGMDADLIMLALAVHEVHFSILREDALINAESEMLTSTSKAESEDVNIWSRRSYKFLHVWILREYLEIDMKISDPPENFQFDVERIIDDFIFMCFFLGNDFLPQMPTLETHEGAIDLLMSVYKKNLKQLGGYLVDMQRAKEGHSTCVNLNRVEKFTLLVATYEEQIFKKRSALRRWKIKNLSENSDVKDVESGTELDMVNDDTCTVLEGNSAASQSEMLKNTEDFIQKLVSKLEENSDVFKNGGIFGTDKVKLGSPGWKDRYYKEKFSVESWTDIKNTRRDLVQKYTEGLLWVLLYYYSEVPSWTWYYPYHYGPFISDLKGLSQVEVHFQKGSPLKPFDQLMCILPPKMAFALPKAYRPLMTENSSSIIDFYPTEFEVDMDGKRFQWQGICRLPFIDEKRLLAAISKVEKDLTEDEAERNLNKVDKLFVRRSSMFGCKCWSVLEKMDLGKQKEAMVEIDPSGQIGGIIGLCNEQLQTNDIQSINVLCMRFELPTGNPHIPRPLEGSVFPDKIISETDIETTVLWHENFRTRPMMRMQNQQRFNNKVDRRSSSSPSPEQRNSGNHMKFKSNSASENIQTAFRPYGQEEKGINNLKISEPRQSFRPYGQEEKGVTNLKISEPRQSFRPHGQEEKGITNLKISEPRQSFRPYGQEEKGVNNLKISEPRQSFRPCGQEEKGVTNLKISEPRQSFRPYGQEEKGVANLKISEPRQSFRPYGRTSIGNSNSFWSSRNDSRCNNGKQILESNTKQSSPSYGREDWGSIDGRNSSHQHPIENKNMYSHFTGRGNFQGDASKKGNSRDSTRNRSPPPSQRW